MKSSDERRPAPKDGPAGPGENGSSSRAGIRILRISALMAAIYLFFHLLPEFAPERPETFLRETTGDLSPELCDFSSLGFTPVTQLRSPFIMSLLPRSSPRAGEEVRVTVALARQGGKPVTLADLEEAHTEKFHLLVIDPTLEDYHHKHPVPTDVPGEYEFRFTPRAAGTYRLFADLLPAATGRPVQAVADLEVAADERSAAGVQRPEGDTAAKLSLDAAVDGFRFALTPPPGGVRAKKPGLISLEVRNSVAGRPVLLEPVMAAYAHLVAFDGARSGFAHMHPVQEGTEVSLDEIEPALEFIFYADRPGRYSIWAQVKIGGREIFAPFTMEVL